MSKYTLVSAAERHMNNPDTFDLPDEMYEIGDFVKLCFNDQERMWVRVTEIGKGTLANIPMIVNLKYGDNIKFESHNIYSVIKGE